MKPEKFVHLKSHSESHLESQSEKSEKFERHELEEIEEKVEDILETLNRLEKLIQSLLPPPPGKAVSAVLDFIS